MNEYFTYMLRCGDGSYYTGSAAHICRRMREHVQKEKNCARYTRTRAVTALSALWQSADRSTAGRLEYHIKTLTHRQKERLTAHPEELSALLGTAVPVEAYTYVPDVTLEACLGGHFHEGD